MDQATNADEHALLESIFLQSARGAKTLPLDLTVERELTAGDLALMGSEPTGSLGSEPPPLDKLRYRHHELARMLAAGEKQIVAAAMCGYSISRVTILLKDPAFVELVEHYRHMLDAKFLDARERLGAIGMSAVEDLDEKNEAGLLTTKEQLALAELALDRSGIPPEGGGQRPMQGRPGQGGVAVQINLVRAPERPGTVVEITAQEGD